MELLEYLCIGTDCVFISDLRECTRFHSIKNALNNLDVRQYTIQDVYKRQYRIRWWESPTAIAWIPWKKWKL